MWLKTIALVLPLGIDTLVVSASLGAAGLPARQQPRITALFALFEGGMPLLGVLVATPIRAAIGNAGGYIASAVLVALGVLALVERDEDHKVFSLTTAHGLALVALGISISLDEFALGISVGLLKLSLLLVVSLIAIQAVVVSQIGFRLGTRISSRTKEVAEKLAALTLIVLGLIIAGDQISHARSKLAEPLLRRPPIRATLRTFEARTVQPMRCTRPKSRLKASPHTSKLSNSKTSLTVRPSRSRRTYATRSRWTAPTHRSRPQSDPCSFGQPDRPW